jgi:hypothetical protein
MCHLCLEFRSISSGHSAHGFDAPQAAFRFVPVPENEKPPTLVDGCRERREAGARYTTMMTMQPSDSQEAEARERGIDRTFCQANVRNVNQDATGTGTERT